MFFIYFQITHRYIERRLLVAESCGVLAPYVTVRTKKKNLELNTKKIIELVCKLFTFIRVPNY